MCSGGGIIIQATPLNSQAFVVSLVGEMRALEQEDHCAHRGPAGEGSPASLSDTIWYKLLLPSGEEG